MSESKILKKDLFGEIRVSKRDNEAVVIRDCRSAAPGLRWLARRLLRREASALAVLEDLDGIAQAIEVSRDELVRSYLDGEPMQRQKPRDPAYFKAAAKLLRQMHRRGVVHNDLAKEPNMLVRKDGSPAIIDFQLAWYSRQRGKTFRVAAREDLRHLLKHKRSYCPESLTSREQNLLANPSFAAAFWRRTVKPVYLFVTRRILGWADREGASDRGEVR
ncbi:MAG: RIO1 family regulatory kinase/ATPase [Woeseiaceae bacterium]